MNNCPNGFFCFQKSLFISILIIIIIIIYLYIKTYYIYPINNTTNNNNNNNIRYKRIYDPLYPPEKTYPINIKTRGDTYNYQQVGFAFNNSNKLPIYGKQTYPGSNKYNYYTKSDGYQSIKLPIIKNNIDCTDERGCEQLNDKEQIQVTSYDDLFTFNSYNFDKPKYIPYL